MDIVYRGSTLAIKHGGVALPPSGVYLLFPGTDDGQTVFASLVLSA